MRTIQVGAAAPKSDGFARPIVLLYWLAILGGLALYTAFGTTKQPMLWLWIGVLGGTAAGQIAALLRFRFWLVAASALALIYLAAPFLVFGPAHNGGHFWAALIPAIACGYWSLGDRAALAAFWFPAMLWMLTILDRSRLGFGAASGGTADLIGGVLVGAIALVFLLFLRARETRRVKVWRTVAATPLAPPVDKQAVLREQAGAPVARAVWTLLVGGVTCAVTAWVAPKLWRLEELAQDRRFESEEIRIANHGDDTPYAGYAGGYGSFNGTFGPCCPVAKSQTQTIHKERVKEYFDLGAGFGDGEGEVHDDGYEAAIRRSCVPCDDQVVDGEGFRGSLGGHYGEPYAYDHTDPNPYTHGSTGYTTNGGYTGGGGGGYGGGGGGGYTAPSDPTPTPTPYTPPSYTPPSYTPPATPTPAPYTPPSYTPPTPAPTAPTVAPPTPTPTPVPSYTPPTPTPHATSTPTPSTAKAPPPPPREPSHPGGAWLVYLLVAGLTWQAVALAMRPLRRAFALRHLRKPYWNETLDQRISNSWQLALVGLRDAGWRASSDEAPREFAARTNIAGIDQCATILERARHGVGLDQGDLDDMARSADTAYHAARGKLGGVGRAAASLRWPLT